MTLTFVCNNYPEKLASFLKGHNKDIEKLDDGIYYIHGEWIPVQIIVQSELGNIDENFPVIILSDNKLFSEAFKMLLKDLDEIKDREDKRRLIEAAFRKNIKEAVEVYKMYEDKINEEVQEYVIKTLKQTKLKIYTEEELKEKEDEGIKEGIEVKTKDLAIKLLKKRIKDLPEEIICAINNTKDISKIENMVEDIFSINSIKDVKRYL